MISNTHFLQKFRRITSNSIYYPEIDGIRFMCVFLVIIIHISTYSSVYFFEPGLKIPHLPSVLIGNGGFGIFAFFMLSGYILSRQFIEAILNEGTFPSIKKYYLRRLTRIEPPYFAALLAFFIILVWILHKYSFSFLLSHFVASLFYVHYIFFPNSHPLVMEIAWTLEVEMAFYIALPAFIFVLYKLKRIYRRLIFFIIIAGLPLLNLNAFVNHMMPFLYLPYFFGGILIAEHIVLNENPLRSIPKSMKVWVLLLLFVLFLYVDKSTIGQFLYRINPLILYAIFVLIIINKTACRFFVNPIITTIGGMCYSLYLTHYAVISLFGKFIPKLPFTNNYFLGLLAYSVIFIIPIIITGFVFYKFIEQPTMKKGWWKKNALRPKTISFNKI